MRHEALRRGAWRILEGLPLALASPMLLADRRTRLAACGLHSPSLRRRNPLPAETRPDNRRGQHRHSQLERPRSARKISAVGDRGAAKTTPAARVIVVDNGSTDGSAAFVRERFPKVRLIALTQNLGFGGGSNAGFRAAKNDIVVLLNSDMRVERDFLAPLLDGFHGRKNFRGLLPDFFLRPGQSCAKRPGSPKAGGSRAPARPASRSNRRSASLYPCFYGGGGSCAFDRRKFLELGGFDELLAPFYLEDTDLGYLAWKRGWKVLYQPASVVYHEHRGTIGKRFSDAYIQIVLKKNFLLFTWKNIHEWRRLVAHFWFTWASAMLSWLFGDSPERANFRASRARAVSFRERWFPAHARGGWRRFPIRKLSGGRWAGHFRDTFRATACQPRTLARAVRLALSDLPAGARRRRVHVSDGARAGAAVRTAPDRAAGSTRMSAKRIASWTDLRVDRIHRAHGGAAEGVRVDGAARGARISQSRSGVADSPPDLYCARIDVLQLEYTVLGQYAGQFRHIPSILFEHDIYFQSIARRLPHS